MIDKWVQAIVENPELAAKLILISLVLNFATMVFGCMADQVVEGKIKSVAKQLRDKGIRVFEWK